MHRPAAVEAAPSREKRGECSHRAGRCSVTIFLTDLDGSVTKHDGNVLAVDGKSNIYRYFYGGNAT